MFVSKLVIDKFLSYREIIHTIKNDNNIKKISPFTNLALHLPLIVLWMLWFHNILNYIFLSKIAN